MKGLVGVNFIKEDFLSDLAIKKIEDILQEKKCDAVLSDMACNTTGDSETDHLRIIHLLEESLSLAIKILNEGGCFVGKIFQGGNSNDIALALRKNFVKVKYFKPKSSRKSSPECYLIAIGFKKIK
jgi:23S rRNA (uridine2552-2'-O)-methyltransferase